jgi:branched-chain amino acid transport system permease protein
VSVVITFGSSVIMYVIVYMILTLGLNLQYGFTGIVNFTYYTFVAVGAYIAGVTALGRPQPGTGELYILGANLPFPIPILLAGLAAGALGGALALVVFRRLRSDYLAIVTLAAGTVALDVATNSNSIFGGSNGIFGIPTPLAGVLGVPLQNSYMVMIPIGLVVLAICWWISHSIRNSPYGRILRSIRDNPDVAEAFGHRVLRHQLVMMLVGCFMAGVGGALTIEFVSAMSPSGWQAVETFIVWAAVIVGGSGNNLGAALGALIMQGVIIQGTLFLPSFGNQELVPAIRALAIGLLVILVLYFRPQGLIPEKRRFYDHLLPGRRGEARPEAIPTPPEGG